VFVSSAIVILTITATAKFVSSFGSVLILREQDPIFGLTYRTLFWLAGSVELMVVGVCCLSKENRLKILLLSLLATAFGIYRLGFILIDYNKPCSCLGYLTASLHISQEASDLIMEVIFFYLLIGSYTILLWTWWNKSKTPPLTPDSEPPISAV